MKLSNLEAFAVVYLIVIGAYYLLEYIDSKALSIAKEEIHRMIDKGYLVDTEKHKQECPRYKTQKI